MAGWRQAVELAMTDEEIGSLAAIAHSRSEAARRVMRGLCGTERVMANALEFRILENGDGWYWEIVAGCQILARGVAESAEAKQKAVAIGTLDHQQVSTDF